MNRVGRIAVAATVMCMFFVAFIIVFTRAQPVIGVPIALVWVVAGYYAAIRINRERADCGRPEMAGSTEQAFLYGGLVSLVAMLAWKVLDVVVYGR
ncbi:hypothetical protein VR010_08155 [Actinomycetaceae bacterium L2_0104]